MKGQRPAELFFSLQQWRQYSEYSAIENAQ